MDINSVISSAARNAKAWTADDQAKLEGVPPDQQDKLKAQMQMQKESELVTLITNLMKQMHETRMSVIRNIG
ncbi:hypothetical protein [Hyalangium minutum]|uniref:Uncharacterized protein n=1 Tax=Hyalangium minutum TaxID=394096 RepID=A0A085WC22_9BACT|nr:hypothetical protein [Hyalangium minutum]KFE65235.1 hypothetical protein DB31_1351 [Hyalangium minutum]